MKKTPLWWDETQLPNIADAPLPGEAEMVIIGGGFAGLSAALTAARQGRQVVILDAGVPGLAGAAMRNAGITSGSIRYSHPALSEKFGTAFADDAYLEGADARADMARFIQDEKIDCQFQMHGHFAGALSTRDYEAMARQAAALNKLPGHEATLIPRSEQHTQIATDRFFGGLLRGDIGGFHPGRFFAGLLSRVIEAGVHIASQTIAADIIKDGATKTIRTSRGDIKASIIINTANAYTGRIHPIGAFLRKRLVPVQSAIIVTEKLGRDKVKELMPALRMYGNTANLYCYFRPTPDQDRILLGARSFDKEQLSPRSARFLKDRLLEIFPDMGAFEAEYGWLGNVAFSQRFLPSIFEKDGVYYVAGYGGSGTIWARWLGIKTAEMALGLRNKPSCFYGPPPPAIPLYDGNPWFMSFVNSWYGVKDRVNEWGYKNRQ